MVGLRSGRQDRVLLLVVWALTVVVLGLGILALSPILLIWGIIGLPAALFLSYVHLRDTRAAPGGVADRTGATRPSAQAADATAPGKTNGSDGIEEESTR